MSSSKQYLNYILEQLSDLKEIRYRPMMGKFIIYYKDKVVGGIYDDRLLLKPAKALVEFIGAVKYEFPYEGAKAMVLVENIDDSSYLCKLIKLV